MADYLQADCLAVHVAADLDGREAVERHMSFARNLRIETHVWRVTMFRGPSPSSPARRA